jgi:HK97 family phage portal protein
MIRSARQALGRFVAGGNGANKWPMNAKQGSPTSFSIGTDGRPISSLVDYKAYVNEGYNQNEVVFACINKIGKNAAQAPLRVWSVDDSGMETVDADSPFNETFAMPNPHMGEAFFKQLIHAYLNLDGNAFVIREKTGEREFHWLPRPDKMSVIPGGGDILGFVYTTETNRKIPFLPEEIIHIKFVNPGDKFDGLGRGIPPLSPAARTADVDNRATQFLDSFFDNAAVPFGMLTSKEIINDDEVARIRARMKKQYSGSTKWHEQMILDADVEYQKLGADVDEIAMPGIRDFTETRICAAFDVPIVLVGVKAGLGATTYNNVAEARRALFTEKIQPDNKLIEDQYTAALRDELADDQKIAHDYSSVAALQEDRDAKFTRANGGVAAGWLTVNDARGEIGLPPDAGGDVYLRGLAMQEVPFGLEEDQSEPSQEIIVGGAETEEGTQEIQAVALNGAQVTAALAIVERVNDGILSRESGLNALQIFFGLTEEQALRIVGDAGKSFAGLVLEEKKVYYLTFPDRSLPLDKLSPARELLGTRFHKQLDLIAEAHESAFKREARKQFKRELTSVLDIIKSAKSQRKQIEDWTALERELFGFLDSNTTVWSDSFLGLFTTLLEEQASNWSDMFGIVFDIDSSVETQVFLNDYSLKFANRLEATTKSQLRVLLAEAQADGWSIRKLTGEVDNLYSGWDKVRAETIARTETIRSSNAGVNEAFAQAGIEAKQWWTAEDARVCPFCNSMHGTIVNTGEVFVPLGGSVVVDVPEEASMDDMMLEFHKTRSGPWAQEGDFVTLNRKVRTVTLTTSYEEVGYPPLHPKCRCTLLPVVAGE